MTEPTLMEQLFARLGCSSCSDGDFKMVEPSEECQGCNDWEWRKLFTQVREENRELRGKVEIKLPAPLKATGYYELELYPLDVNAWEAGVLMKLIMVGQATEVIPRFWRKLLELKKATEAGDGVVKEFLPNDRVRLTDVDGTVITRKRFAWEIPDEG